MYRSEPEQNNLEIRKSEAPEQNNLEIRKSEALHNTSLPPAVAGHQQATLVVSIPKIVWAIPNIPLQTYVRLCWWGDKDAPTQFWCVFVYY